MTRFPVEPLLAMFPPVLMRVNVLRDGYEEPGTAWVGSNTLLAEAAGVHCRSVVRWRQQGLSWSQADRIAGKLGMGPWEVWEDWFDVSLREAG